jgi:hypothetical protein
MKGKFKGFSETRLIFLNNKNATFNIYAVFRLWKSQQQSPPKNATFSTSKKKKKKIKK